MRDRGDGATAVQRDDGLVEAEFAVARGGLHRTLNRRAPLLVSGSEAAEGSENEPRVRAGAGLLGGSGPVGSVGMALISKICMLSLV